MTAKSVWDVRVACGGLDHPECLNFGLDGTLYAGGEAGQIYKIDIARSTYVELANTSGFILGVAVDGEDNVYACDCGKHCVFRISRDGDQKEFARAVEGGAGPINFPNYGLFDDLGNYYFTDSGEYWRTTGRLIRVSADGTARSILGDKLSFPNGLALSKDGKTLFMVESTAQRVLSIPLEGGGSIGIPQVYVQLPGYVPDGIALDEEGNLFTSCYTPEVVFRIDHLTRKAEILLADPTAEILNRPTNLAFAPTIDGGLYISNFGSSNVSVVDVGAKGQKLRYPRFS